MQPLIDPLNEPSPRSQTLEVALVDGPRLNERISALVSANLPDLEPRPQETVTFTLWDTEDGQDFRQGRALAVDGEGRGQWWSRHERVWVEPEGQPSTARETMSLLVDGSGFGQQRLPIFRWIECSRSWVRAGGGNRVVVRLFGSAAALPRISAPGSATLRIAASGQGPAEQLDALVRGVEEQELRSASTPIRGLGFARQTVPHALRAALETPAGDETALSQAHLLRAAHDRLYLLARQPAPATSRLHRAARGEATRQVERCLGTAAGLPPWPSHPLWRHRRAAPLRAAGTVHAAERVLMQLLAWQPDSAPDDDRSDLAGWACRLPALVVVLDALVDEATPSEAAELLRRLVPAANLVVRLARWIALDRALRDLAHADDLRGDVETLLWLGAMRARLRGRAVHEAVPLEHRLKQLRGRRSRRTLRWLRNA